MTTGGGSLLAPGEYPHMCGAMTLPEVMPLCRGHHKDVLAFWGKKTIEFPLKC